MAILSGVTISGSGVTIAGGGAPATDPYFMYNSLLLPGNGTNTAQNNTFLDGSTNNFTITRNGNTTQGTFSPYGVNWSSYCGTSNNFYMNGEAGFAFGSSADFTIQFWFLANSISADVVFYDSRPTTTQGLYPTIYLNGTTKVISYVTNGAERITGTTSISVGTWYNVVLSRVSGTTRLFVNGTSQGSWADTTAYTNPANRPTICVSGYAANGYLDGYISNFSVLNGTGYTTVTVPTTPLSTSTTNQILLLGASNRLVDSNTAISAKTINITGSPSIQRFSPFSPSTAYDTSTIGGSGYFDGTGDYLTAPQNAAFNFGTGAFTVEAWVYLTAYPSGGEFTSIFSLGNGAAGGVYTGWGLLFTNTSISFYRYDGSTESNNSVATAIPLNRWSHVVAVRNGSSSLSIYLNGTRILNTTSSLAYNNVNSDNLNISYWNSGASPTVRYVTGYISDGRIVKGTAVYDPTVTTLTVPTAPLTAVSGTQLLLNYTNAGIIDNAMMNDLQTVGNAQISTTQSKFGGGSMYFDGTGDWLFMPPNSNNDLGTGNFTIEMWIYPTAALNTFRMLMAKATNTDETYISLSAGGTGGQLDVYGGSILFNLNNSISINTWAHLAIVRVGNTWTAYVNGTSLGSNTSSLAFNLSGIYGTYIGRYGQNPAYEWNGYINDLRITKGYARYTSNFTPPTTAFPLN